MSPGASRADDRYRVGMDRTAVVPSTHELGSVRLASIGAGEGGVPLLLVHGFTGCKEDFADELELLAAMGYHAVAPDLRGHGDSDAPSDEAEYSLATFAADLFELVEDLGWERFDLLGHSMGGMIAQVMVLDRPALVDRLVLMDTHHGPLDDIDVDLVALGIELARTQGLAVIQQVLQMGADPLANPAYERVCAEREGYREWAENKMLRASPVMYAAMLGELSTVTDRLDSLATLDRPTLVQVGELDRAFVAASERMAATIPGARLAVHPDAGHCPQFEATEHWRDALHGFLGPAARADAVA